MPGGASGITKLEIVRLRYEAKEDAYEAWRASIIEAFLEGASTRQIAEYAGLTHEGVRLIIRKAGY